MRIFIAHNFYQQSGGEDQIFAAEAELLRSKGHEVITHSVHNDSVDGMNRFSLAIGTVWNRTSYRTLRSRFRASKPDVVHIHNSFPLISPAIYYAARAAGSAVVQSLHNFRLSCPNAFFYRNGSVCEECLGKRFAWPAIRHGCYRGSRAATTVSAGSTAIHRAVGTYDRLIHRYVANTRFGATKFAQCGIRADRIAVKPNFLADDPGPGSGAGGYALFVGRLSPEKGIEDMLHAFANADAGPLRIVGAGPEQGKVEAAAAAHANITYLGKQPRKEVLRLMREAGFLVFPSRWYEGFPMTIVEAFACGLPVIASNLGCMSSVIEHRQTGLHFAAGDPQDLAKQVCWARNNGTELAAMRGQVRREFERKYTPEPNYQTLMQIYGEAIGEREKAPLQHQPSMRLRPHLTNHL